MEALNKAGLTTFVKMITDKGWVNGNTGAAMMTAVAKILEDVGPEEDVRKIDVETASRRYSNLHPGDLSPGSLDTYRKRVKSAIANYISWVEDPTKYRPPGSARATTNGSTTPKKVERPKGTTASEVTVIEPIPAPTPATAAPRMEMAMATEANLALPYPLRPGYLAQVIIPRDMKKVEAARLCAFIMTLAVDE